MISIQKRFLFVHVPKTGGNSIQNVLSAYSEDNIVVLGTHQDGIERFGVRNKNYDTNKHSTLSRYKSVLDRKTYNSLFKFATMRNPWDRLVSFYFSPHRHVTEWNRADFLTLVQRVAPLRHFICEKSALEKAFAKFGLPYERLRRRLDSDINFLMRFEHLDSDFRTICEKLDIPYTPLPKRNSSSRRHYSTYYDSELIEIVQQKFAEEITLGNYQFERAL